MPQQEGGPRVQPEAPFTHRWSAGCRAPLARTIFRSHSAPLSGGLACNLSSGILVLGLEGKAESMLVALER